MIRATVLLAASMFVGSALACDNPSACKMTQEKHASSAAAGEIAPDATQASFTVAGMDCGLCAKGIRAALEAIDGVSTALVDVTDGSVKVAYDPAKVSTDKLTSVISEHDGGKYKATLAKS